MSKIILTGDRPTGRLHVGHYVGSLKERVKLQNSGDYDEIYIMIADAQALTDNAEHPEKVRQNIIQVALDYLACGIDPAKSTYLYPVYGTGTDRTYILLYESCYGMHVYSVTLPLKLRFRCVILKQAFRLDFSAIRSVRRQILPLSVQQHVPVGEDQMPMIEQCKEIVHKFNTVYGETLTDPEDRSSVQ